MFPEAVNEDGIDIETLVNLLGKEESRRERYRFTWAGKQDAILNLHQKSKATLKPVPEESVNWHNTGHLFIEGDNRQVMKLLYRSYFGRVKMIYIDPPYNTGNDFVYRDNFSDPLNHYLRLTGQVDDDGNLQTTDVDKAGRLHSSWLNMMYPRLLLARQLLSDDGVIFISIDDNEVHNLRKLMDEIFGEENSCGTFIWERKKKPSFLDRNMGTVTEYIVAYAKYRHYSPPFIAGAVEDGKKYPFNNAGNPVNVLTFPPGSIRFSIPNQTVTAQDMSTQNIFTELLDDVEIIDGSNANGFRLKGTWRYSQSKVDEFVERKDEIRISKVPFRPNYVNRSGDTKKTINLLSHRVNEIPSNEDATEELRKIFGSDVMSYPKPTGLLSYLVRSITSGEDIVLDFFAGSATTAHAVLQQNRHDGGNRKFIMIQLPEPMVNPQFANIAEVGKERIRRVIQKMQGESAGMLDGLQGLPDEDLGFRVFKLDESPLRQWPDLPTDTTSPEEYLKQMELMILDPLLEGWTLPDVITEVALKEFGFSLTWRVEQFESGARQTIYKVIDDEQEQYFYICLDEKIVYDTIKHLDFKKDDRFVFRDSAIDDTIIANLALTCRIKSI